MKFACLPIKKEYYRIIASKIRQKNMAPIEQYLKHLDNIFQQEPLFFGGGKDEKGVPKASVMIYENVPEVGYITAITYGLSLVNHPDWTKGRPELCITVKSTDRNWGLVASYLATSLRGDCPFGYGQTINFSDKVSEDSEMDAFFVFAPAILKPEDYTEIDIGLDYKININGLYPMYADELETYDKIGFNKFWHHPNFDIHSVNRERITGE